MPHNHRQNSTLQEQSPFREKTRGPVRGLAGPLILFLLLMLFLWTGSSAVSQSSGRESGRILEDAVRRAVVQCYVCEGMYPPDLQYLTDHYGLSVDTDNFIVHYEAFASNLFPTITVISLND